jgi:hypothetical protein
VLLPGRAIELVPEHHAILRGPDAVHDQDGFSATLFLSTLDVHAVVLREVQALLIEVPTRRELDRERLRPVRLDHEADRGIG